MYVRRHRRPITGPIPKVRVGNSRTNWLGPAPVGLMDQPVIRAIGIDRTLSVYDTPIAPVVACELFGVPLPLGQRQRPDEFEAARLGLHSPVENRSTNGVSFSHA